MCSVDLKSYVEVMWFRKKPKPASRVARAPREQGPGSVARMPCVRVEYCELWEAPPTGTQGWAYRWPLEQAPNLGDRVFVTSAGSQALHPAVVVGLDRGSWTGHMKWVRRLATPQELKRARS